MRLPTTSVPELLLRIAAAFAFAYPPVAALGDPYSWMGYFPGFLTNLANGNELALLHAFGVLEIALALWILFGRRVVVPSVLALLLLLLIVAFNMHQFPILFRDVSIALALGALAIMNRARHG